MIAEAQFDALVAFMIDRGVCSGPEAATMIDGLNQRLADSNAGWQIAEAELSLQRGRLNDLSAQCRAMT